MVTTYLDLRDAREVYARGENLTEHLRRRKGVSQNSPEIIEIAYDLQAGEYVRWTLDDLPRARAYAGEVAEILGAQVNGDDVLLDVGTGEITTFSLVIDALPRKPRAALGFDISWSRLNSGKDFASRYMGETFARFTPFVADLNAIPLMDKSVDITTSSHSLEPNGDNLAALLSELFRVTRRALVLFEPCYEMASEEAKRRMERLGYIRGMETVVATLGGTVEATTPIRHVANPLNPTAAFLIRPPAAAEAPSPGDTQFAVPGSSIPLEEIDGGFWYSRETGLCFPSLRGIPVLRETSAILASSLAR